MAARKAKPKKAPARGPSPHRTLAWVAVKGLLAAGLVAAALAGIAWLGNRAGEQVVGRGRYTVRVADISCNTPPGKDRVTFLTEVRYKAGLPESIQAVDPALQEKLSAAFARHPWVAAVRGVTVGPDGSVHVELGFRTPVLAVVVAGEAEPRAVDKAGVLLPAAPDRGTLPRLTTPVLPPTRPEGEPWDDPTVRRAAELAELYRPRLVEKTDKGWRLTHADGRAVVVSY